MLIVISDLHLTESTPGANGAIRFNRNLPPKAYAMFIDDMVMEAQTNQATHIDLVLAGDIFEMLKSPLWYEDDQRPYLCLEDIRPGSPIETKILRLLDLIAKEELVDEPLAMFRDFHNRFDIDVRLHYLAGNHDRIVNATPATRSKARELLGVAPSSARLPFTFMYAPAGDPLVFIRHGHEYDHSNFVTNFKNTPIIPENIPFKDYDAPPLGEFLSVEFSERLPFFLVELYGLSAIQKNDALGNLYLRLSEFDDVRPLSALVHFLLTTPGLTPEEAWDHLEPVFIEALNAIADNELFLTQMETSHMANYGNFFLIKKLLQLHPWRKGIPFWLINRLSRFVSKNLHFPESDVYAAREEVLKKYGDKVRCVITGHTHSPMVALMDTQDGIERYHINTGTWRNVVPTARDQLHFGRIKALAHVAVYGADENRSLATPNPAWSFDYWSGFSQKFTR